MHEYALNREKHLLKEVNCVMVTNWMHRNVGKSDSIFRFESVAIICQKETVVCNRKTRKMLLLSTLIPLAGYPGVSGSPAPFRLRTFPLWAAPPGRFQPSGYGCT